MINRNLDIHIRVLQSSKTQSAPADPYMIFNIIYIMRMPSMFVAVALDSSSWHVQ